MSKRALENVRRLLEEGRDADEVLRRAVSILTEEPGVVWAGIAFLEDSELVLGPSAGEPDETRRTRVAVTFQADPVGELWVDGEADTALLERVAELVSAHVLIGWDTGGERWEP